MPDEIKPNPIAEARAKAKAEALVIKQKRDALKLNIGKSFTDGERNATVQGFYADKVIGAETQDSFLVNFGNLNRSDFLFCEQFLSDFKSVKK